MNAKPHFLLALMLILGSELPARSAEPDAKGIEFFETKIRPLFAEHCYSCHSEDARKAKKLKGGLSLDNSASILKGGESGVLFTPGKDAESLLLKSLRYDDLKMPPKAKLPDALIANVETWIKMGAPLPKDSRVAATQPSVDWDKARQFWAYQLPVKHPRPRVQDERWPRGEIDFFILAELEKRDLKPVGQATKRDLIRRATFDLIGLPPTPEEIDAFEQDNSADAFAKVVDRLLASPHYGERWARYWLDVARYADDKALAVAKPSPHAFRYRDWVVQALNQDMPYDRFLQLQIAGDLLPEPKGDPFTRLAGLGFQGLGAEYHKGNFAAQVMADELDDRVDTLTRGLLGLTVACARCHDHKYDPIPTRDYYSLAAAYQGANMSDLPLASPEEVNRVNAWEQERKNQEAALAKWQQEKAKAVGKAALQDIGRYLTVAYRIRAARERKKPFDEVTSARDEKIQLVFVKRLLGFLEPGKVKVPAEFTAWRAAVDKALSSTGAVELPEDLKKRIDELQSSARAALQEQDKIDHDFDAALAKAEPKDKGKIKKATLNATHDAHLKALWLLPQAPFFVEAKDVTPLLEGGDRQEFEERNVKLDQHKKAAPPPVAMIHGVSGGGQAMKVLNRGRVENVGEDAPPGFLRILRRTEPTEKRFSRLELANAIASPQNPLTARVFVNRVWQYHFGRGIVGTSSNFGLLGDRPTHPELLDTLATRFMESGWSIKALHREMMLSATYQLSSDNQRDNAAKDPENRELWRMAPRRLDVEAWRDSLLAVSGRLDRTLGGPSLDPNGPKNVRRTLYGLVSRSVPNPMLTAFDFPDANVSSAQRSVTTVPQQQLFVLNSEFMIEAAKAFAARLEKGAKENEQRIDFAFRLAYGRLPTAKERELGLAFLELAATGKEKLTAWEQYAQALLATNEFAWVE